MKRLTCFLLAINIIWSTIFWFRTLTDYAWTSDFLNYQLPGLLGFVSIGTIYYLFKNAYIYRKLWLIFLFPIAFSIVPFVIEIAWNCYAPENNTCFLNQYCAYSYVANKEISSPDGEKTLVICDVVGPSGIENVQIHFKQIPIKRDLVVDQWGALGGLHLEGFYNAKWLDDNTLFTQDPDKLESEEMIHLNIWKPRINFSACMIVLIYYCLMLSFYGLSPIIRKAILSWRH